MSLTNSREKVLERVRASLGRGPQSSARERAGARAYMDEHPAGPQPAAAFDRADQIAGFETQSLKLSASVVRVPGVDQVPEAVARYLNLEGLGNRAVTWPRYADLNWAAHGLQVEARAPNRSLDAPDMVGITGCFAAIAETGTLAMASGPDSPASMNLLPETHVAIVPASRIVPHMEDVFALVRDELGQLPRAFNFISGPSRTADIEQTIVLGAHGPYRVHIIILERD